MKSPDQAAFKAILIVSVVLALVLLPAALKADSHHRHGPPPFSEFDQDGDGFVSEEEFNSTREAHHEAMAAAGRPMKGMGTAPAFGDIDADGDGRLSEIELTKAQQAHMAEMREAHGDSSRHGHHAGQACPHHGKHRASFEDLDTDGNGCISPEEFEAHHSAMGKSAPADAQH